MSILEYIDIVCFILALFGTYSVIVGTVCILVDLERSRDISKKHMLVAKINRYYTVACWVAVYVL